MVMPFRLAAVVTAVLAVSAGCAFQQSGEGAVQTQSRQADAFSRIEVDAGIGITVSVGEAQSIVVSAQENILPVISTEVEDDTLRIGSTQPFTTSEAVNVTVVVPTLDGISLSGGSQGQVEGVDGGSLDLELGGGAGLAVTGVSSTVALEASGGSDVDLEGLQANAVTLDVSGGSNVTVQASDEVTGSASGESRVTVLGDAQVDVEVSSGAEVTPG